jgi:hypothetical protein
MIMPRLIGKKHGQYFELLLRLGRRCSESDAWSLEGKDNP